MRLCHCGAITKKGLCERCKPTRVRKQEKTAERGYDHRWRKLSEYQRERRPLCEVCNARDKYTPATELHHIEKIRQAPDKRLAVSNTVAVCSPCHAKIEGMGRHQLDAYLNRLSQGQ